MGEDKELRVGVLSDTHLRGVTPALQEICERCFRGVDVVLHAGDVVSSDVVKYLEAWPFHGVYGNMDPPEVRGLLPAAKVLELGGWRVGLTHGGGSPEGLEDRVAEVFSGEDVHIIVYGHSHRPANFLRKGVLFFNPGTATGYSRTGSHTVGVLEMGSTVRGHIMELDV
ncbi:MAG: metallophosphoesterase family protein [Desulfobacteraceae bacterium]